MLLVKCRCGAQYRVPETLAGKRVHCKHCPSVLTIPHPGAAEPAAEEDSFLSLEAAAAAERGRERVDAAPAPAGPIAPPIAPPSDDEDKPLPPMTAGMGAYMKDVLWSFLFVADPGSLINFLFVAVIAAVQPFLGFGCLGVLGQIIVAGWFCGYFFNVIEDSAAGEQELPGLTISEGIVEDIIRPIEKFFLTTFVAFLPAFAYWALHKRLLGIAMTLMDPVFLLLCALGVFVWPIMVLVAALGGETSLFRLDLIFRTVARTFVPYLVTFFLTMAAFIGFFLVQQGILMTRQGIGRIGSGIGLAMIFEVLSLYASIVAMRTIGLYYHHFKARFAWSWE